MADNPVLRRNSFQECGLPVGQLNIKIKDSIRPFETISFYCTQPKGHLDLCCFEGEHLVVTRKASYAPKGLKH